MMPIRDFVAASAVCAILTSCAPPAAAPEGPSPPAGERITVVAPVRTWTATLNPTQSVRAGAVATERQKAYGTVELFESPSRETRTRVRLTVSLPDAAVNTVGWAIHPGNCGSGTPPVMAPGAFPAIVISANGRGTIEEEIAYTLPESGNYHVNVFRGAGTQLNDVLTCGSLRRKS